MWPIVHLSYDRDRYLVTSCNIQNVLLQLFSKKREPLGIVKLDAALKRPSGIVFDDDLNQNPVLYVANLWDNSVYKFSLIKAM